MVILGLNFKTDLHMHMHCNSISVKHRHRSIISHDDVVLAMLSVFYVIHICIRGEQQLVGYYVINYCEETTVNSPLKRNDLFLCSFLVCMRSALCVTVPLSHQRERQGLRDVIPTEIITHGKLSSSLDVVFTFCNYVSIRSTRAGWRARSLCCTTWHNFSPPQTLLTFGAPKPIT